MCILFVQLYVYALLKVVGHYDLSVLSMSVMSFQKNVWIGWVGGVSSIQFILDFLNFYNFAKPLRTPLARKNISMVWLTNLTL